MKRRLGLFFKSKPGSHGIFKSDFCSNPAKLLTFYFTIHTYYFDLFCRVFLSKLPDKGEKIKGFREKIIKEIERRNEVDEAARLLSKLNIAQDGKSAMNQLEWTGKYSEKDLGEKIVELDSDDDEDPLKILAQVGKCLNNKLEILKFYY